MGQRRWAFFLLCAVSWWALGARGESHFGTEIDAEIQRAGALQDKGDLKGAKAIYEGLLPSLRASQPTSQLGAVLVGLSQVAAADGDYDLAIKNAQEGADAYHAAHDSGGEADALNNRGLAEIQRGEYSAAQSDLARALELSQSAGNARVSIRILNNLGSAYFFRGSYQEAQGAYLRALDLIDQHRQEKWSGYSRQFTDINQATLYQRLGRYEKALEIYRHIETSPGDLTPADRAHLLTNLGALYRRLGDPWKALSNYQDALQLYSLSHDADGEISALKNIGIVYALDLEDLRKADGMFRQSLRLAVDTHNQREVMQGHLYLGETLYRERNLKDAQSEFQQAFTDAQSLQTKEEQWKALYGLGRTQQAAGDAQAAESAFRRGIEIIEQTRATLQLSALRAEFLADKRDVYDALIALLFERRDTAAAFSFLERSRARNFQDRLLARDQAAHRDALTLDETRHMLPPGTILLEYWTAGDLVASIWITSGRSGMALQTVSSDDARKLRQLLKDMPEDLDNDWRDKANFLRRVLPLDPPLVQGQKHIWVVPDGWISLVPFEMLPVEAGSSSLLVEQFDITYLPTASLMQRPALGEGQFRLPWNREVTAFGDPITAPDSQAPLPYSAEEIRNITEMARGRSSIFLGAEDLKSRFLSGEIDRGSLLHVSTHAFADVDNPENSRLLFSPETGGDRESYIYLRELYETDLGSVRLGTISACETERGKMIRGEGVQAFSRALLAAGCRSSLTTLWRVDDRATAEFMKQFYFFLLEEHQPKAEALRLAKLTFLSSNASVANPRYWAAFVLNGEGETPVPRFISWSEIILAATGVLLLAVLLVRLLLWRARRSDRLHHS